MKRKKIFAVLFLFLTGILIFLPFLMTFNDVLTKTVERYGLYQFLQQKIVPYEIIFVGVVLKLLGMEYTPYREGIQIDNIFLKFSWNCLGWQSLVIFLVTLVIGLRGSSYTFISKSKTVVLGLLGIFWVNILRITFTIILATFSLPLFRYVFHDILASVVTIVFLFCFWWFSFKFILEEKAAQTAA